MAFWGDYHTHTVYSHGKGCIEENVLRAAKLGLRELAIADHGFGHMFFNVRRSELDDINRQIAMLREKYPSVLVYTSVESNIVDTRGHIDIKPRNRDKLDMAVCGFHKLVWSPPSATSFFVSNFFNAKGKRAVVRNTEAYIKAIEHNEIDILSHPGNFCACDIKAVAQCCKQYGTFFEINAKRILISDAEFAAAAETGVEFVCDSDAHTPRAVGNFNKAIEVIERVGIPYAQVANYDRLPAFRSRKVALLRAQRGSS